MLGGPRGGRREPAGVSTPRFGHDRLVNGYDRGTLILLTPERLTASNPEHVELGRRVRDLLARAGLFREPARQTGEGSLS